MEYEVRTAELTGEMVTLYAIAYAMADHRANAGNLGFHAPAFAHALPEYAQVLIGDANSGRLQVCDQFGHLGTPSEILKRARLKSQPAIVVGNESMTLSHCVYVRLHQLNLWAHDRGDSFRIKWQEWVDERGQVVIPKPEQSSEKLLQTNHHGAEIGDDGPVSLSPGSKAPGKRTKRHTWRDVSFNYLVKTYQEGQYSSAKAFYKAIESKAGADDSPFDKGKGQDAGRLFVRAIGKTIGQKTIENAWPDIRFNR